MSMYMPNYEMPSSRLGNEGICTLCLKITEKVSFNMASIGQKLIINAQFGRVFENAKLAVKKCYQTGHF